MCNDDAKVAEELELDELDSATGGVVINVQGRNPETAELTCPKCGSGNIAGVETTVFRDSNDYGNFAMNTNLMCKKCHYFAKGTKFRLRLI